MIRVLSIKRLLFGFVFLVFVTATGYAQGSFVYVNNNNIGGPNSVTAFSVAANGVLTPIAGSPFLTGGTGNNLGLFAANRSTICTMGNRLYVANDGSNNVTGFDINPATGFLTIVPGSPFATGGIANGSGMSLDCTDDAKFLIAAYANSSGPSSNITVFSIAANGTLAPVPGSPFPAINQPRAIKVSPSSGFLFVAEGDNLIEAFSISANGALTPVPGSPFPGGATLPFSGVAGLEINCAGTLLFVPLSGFPGGVSVFNISPAGALTPISGSPFPTGGLNALAAVLSPNEQFLFVSNQMSGITVHNVAGNGSLSLVPGSPFSAGASPQQLSINKSGSLLYVNSGTSGTLSVLSIAGNGVLTTVPGSPFPAGSGTLPSVSAFPPKSCDFDICLQDESNGNLLRVNSTTGAYEFTDCKGVTIGGTGRITRRGCLITLEVNGPDRRVLARIDTCMKSGTASVQLFSTGRNFSVFDRNIANNTCACPGG